MSNISRGLALELRSVGANFIDSYLDSLKGIEESNKIILEKMSNENKSYQIYQKVMKFNDDFKIDFKEEHWAYIEKSVSESLYKMISTNKIILAERVL